MHVNDTAALYSVYRSGAVYIVWFDSRTQAVDIFRLRGQRTDCPGGLIHDINFWTSQHWEIRILNNTKDSNV